MAEDQFDDLKPWMQSQYKAFKNFINYSLKDEGMRVEKLETDLEDGLVLLALLTKLSGGKQLPRHNKTPRFRIQ